MKITISGQTFEVDTSQEIKAEWGPGPIQINFGFCKEGYDMANVPGEKNIILKINTQE